MSHLDFRHRIYKERLDARPHPHALLFSAGEVPLVLNRLRSVARSAGQLPAREVYVMDSGMAAVVGASLDTDVPKIALRRARCGHFAYRLRRCCGERAAAWLSITRWISLGSGSIY